MPTPGEKRILFRRLHDQGFFILPNAWDAGSAVLFTKLGFQAIASTSSGAAWTAGRADGELTLNDVLTHLRMLVDSTDLPVNADFENGFAESPADVACNVTLAVGTGIAGVSIEDWSGGYMYDAALARDRIAAARAAIDAVDPTVMLIGRNENFRVPGMTASESIERAVAYSEAGADCLFVPLILDHGAITELVAAVAPKPVNVLLRNYNGSISELAALGVRRCSTGGGLAAMAWKAVKDAARDLIEIEKATTGA